MMKFHKIVATFFGVGYLGKGSGTLAAILYCIIWFLLPAWFTSFTGQLLTTALIVGTGIWSSGEVDVIWGKDSSKVVIDEVAGMAISLLFVPHNIYLAFGALLVFRFFDIVKPLFIRQMEAYPKGWGVMADDILSGVYTLLLIHLVIRLFKL